MTRGRESEVGWKRRWCLLSLQPTSGRVEETNGRGRTGRHEEENERKRRSCGYMSMTP